MNNGGTCGNYRWEQTLQDVTVFVPIPKGTKAKFLTVEMGKKVLPIWPLHDISITNIVWCMA